MLKAAASRPVAKTGLRRDVLALVVQQFVVCSPAAAHLACLASPDSIIGIANSFWDLVPFR